MTTYLITGTTRGIGRSLVSNLLLRPNTTIIAGVRNPDATTAQSLNNLPKAQDSKLIVVKLDSSNDADAKTAVSLIQQDHAIQALDTVIANAGYAEPHGLIGEVSCEAMLEHYKINTLAPLLLFQATLPLLTNAKSPKFVVTSSAMGSATIAPELTAPLAAYGASKAAVNHLMKKASGEYPDVGFVVVHPGLVATEMGGKYQALTGEKPMSLEESIDGYLKVLDLPVEETKGKFLAYSGDEMPW